MPNAEQLTLRAGPLSLIYVAGDLRYIKLGEHELLRRLYVAVRDRNWGTVPAVLSNVRAEVGPDSFRIGYDAEHTQGDVDFAWRGSITGDARGTITFTMDGVARSTFLRNRIGLCVLHPMDDCAGRPCVVEQVDGTREQGVFPRFISPHQPFQKMRAIAHEVVPGVWAEVRMSGDTFEMEDQRNWTDASYKTYSTPLSLPFPVEVAAGTRIAQSVTLNLRGEIPAPRAEAPGLHFTLGEHSGGALPRIGLGSASHGQPLTPTESARLKALHLAHLRVDLRLSEPAYPSTLRRAATEARVLGVELEIALFLSDAARDELRVLRAQLEQVQPPVCTWLVFHAKEKSTTARWVRLAREVLADYAPSARLGGGTNAYFTELNRERPPVADLELVSYSINPQVHAFDDASLVETLQGQAATVESARRFCGALPLAISPVTLKPRFNPNATDAATEPAPGVLPAEVDARQASLFGAGWTAGSLKYLSESGVYSVTYYETSGWRGVMETARGSPLPEAFPSLPGTVFPLYHVLADIGEFAGGAVIPTVSIDPLLVDGLALSKNGRTRIVLANLTATAQEVTLHHLPARAEIRYLDGSNADAAMRSPEDFRARAGEPLQTMAGMLEIKLRPHALARIDLPQVV